MLSYLEFDKGRIKKGLTGMRYGKLKKKLKKGYYLQFKGFCLYFSPNIYKFWLKGKKLRKKPTREYDYVCEGAYDSFICEVEEWKVYSNKAIKEIIKQEKPIVERNY